MVALAFLLLVHAAWLQFAAQVLKNVLCVHVAGDEVDALTHEFRQNCFAISIDGCHFDKVHDALPQIPSLARLCPGRNQLIRPLAGQMTLERPPLLVGQFDHSDLEQYVPLRPAVRVAVTLFRSTALQTRQLKNRKGKERLNSFIRLPPWALTVALGAPTYWKWSKWRRRFGSGARGLALHGTRR